ncbi:hypothetical protein HMPREF0373_03380 [Eubacterium ramulus ATCC 29099]|uniref:Uncharacterized protein n=1 Tax=Eubacterium ramulus ATCC 29099 TaxID=1256908 RepID=U2QQ08_EUBRA|nr:hypothetical protein HMPREF0373_03380 [Eubacterium ramulus ATCC 29099]
MYPLPSCPSMPFVAWCFSCNQKIQTSTQWYLFTLCYSVRRQ